MNRPPLEVADIVRSVGQSFVERSRKWINRQHEKVLLAITGCRTAALGGHRDQCSDCGHTSISYNSCRNRHSPKRSGRLRYSTKTSSPKPIGLPGIQISKSSRLFKRVMAVR
jgi:hypothetical protein